MDAFDVIVLGVGTMGAAAAAHLAQRGARVLGLEQFTIPNTQASHHGDTRVIRLCYYEHPDYVPLLRRAYELWRELEARSGDAAAILHETGGVYMGRPTGGLVSGTLRSAAEHGLDHQRLSHRDLRTRFPQFHLPEDFEGVWEPSAGFLLSERAIADFASLARRHGAQLREGEPALHWSADQSSVTVRTAGGTCSGSHLVICGGAWSAKIMRGLGLPLRITRQTLGWVQPLRPERFAFGVMPVFGVESDEGTLHYGFPMLPADGFGAVRPGFKFAHHWLGPEVDPDALDRQPRADDEREFRGALQRLLPEADGPLLAMSLCMYTCTADLHFIIDQPPRLSESGRVTIACGFSGHGFKFASVVGEILADLALDGRTRHPIGFLSAARFASR